MTMHAITPPPAHHFDEMLVTAGAPERGQSQSQSQSAGGQSQVQSQGTRAHYAAYNDWLQSSPEQTLAQRRAQADLLFRRIGITFTVYGDEGGTERLIPSDVIPRIITADEWSYLEKGLT